MSVTANVVVVQGIRTKSSWYVSEDGGPDCLGKKMAEYLLDGNNDSFDSFAEDNKMSRVNGRKSAVWVYIVDFENRSVELDGVVYGYHEFYARCCMDTVHLPYFTFEEGRNSFEYTDTPRTTMYNFESARPSLCGGWDRDIPPIHCNSLEFCASSLEKEDPVLKI